MSRNASHSSQGPGPNSPIPQQLEWHQNAHRRVAQNLARTQEHLRQQREQRDLNSYVEMREAENKANGMEALVVQLTRELDEHKQQINALKVQLKQEQAENRALNQTNADLTARNLQQAATIKHQSQLIQNPRTAIATPSHGHENIAPVSAAYTAPPPPRYNMSNSGSANVRSNPNGYTSEAQFFGNASTNRQYLNATEQGSPEPRGIPGNKVHSRVSSASTNPFSPTANVQQNQYNGNNSRPSTSSTHNTTTSDNSMALVLVQEDGFTSGTIDLTKGFEHAYSMVETFARAHVNFVSSEKDGNMPQAVKQALLSAAAPANAFPFMAKPESRYHMVAKLMVIWINKNVLRGVSFAGFNAQVNSMILAVKNKIFQGTPVVIKAMYMKEISNHVKGLMNAQGFKEFFQQVCRDKGNDLWKLIKPMMHQKTNNDWSDMYALMYEFNKLAVDMMLSGNEFTFESVDIQARFDQRNMINKEQTMMGISGEDLAHRGAVVKLGVTPKVLARGYTLSGNVNTGLIYRATVLTKWAEVRQDFSAHRRN